MTIPIVVTITVNIFLLLLLSLTISSTLTITSVFMTRSLYPTKSYGCSSDSSVCGNARAATG